MTPTTNASLIALAEAAQRRAADPAASVWVAANAGTGKTKVLTDRVLTLLLSGLPPERLLCLTYTKAAAAEMANRLSRRLADWAVAEEETLRRSLASLHGRSPSDADLAAARRLFARLLDIPGGMRIETIHAFCTGLLRRFPLEAGVPPQFETLEEQEALLLLDAARDAVLIQAQRQPDSPLAQALAVVLRSIHELRFPELMAEIVAHRGKFKRLLAAGTDKASSRLRQEMDLGAEETPESILAAACSDQGCDRPRLAHVAMALSQGAQKDQTGAARINAWLSADLAGRRREWQSYKTIFLTEEGNPRSARLFPSKTVKDAFPAVLPLIAQETDRLLRVESRVNAARVAQATEALLLLAQAVLQAYGDEKTRQGRLDFDDLILATRSLLSTREDAAWALYKLDGGIDHILIDEAQDTSLDQWAITEALMGDFFAGHSAHPQRRRTLFVVGDRKQSIYSFQGADPDAFEARHALYAKAVADARLQWADVALDVSFRSTEPILSLVDKVFAPPAVSQGVESPHVQMRHLPQRLGHAGSVELWPAMPALLSAPLTPWQPPTERVRGESAAVRLARLIARRIRAMIGAERLESRNRPVRAGDILILVRRRGPFVEELIRALKTLSVPVAGVDRMVLTAQLAVMDVLALSKSLLLPEDDLTLACALKSPLIGLEEEHLFEIAYGRPPKVSLWQALREKADAPGPLRDAYVLLSALREKADFLPPHDLFSYILGPLGGRRKLLARLGPDAADALDELLNQSLAYDRSRPPSLLGFVRRLESSAQDVKRDQDEGGGMVRVMTVHGAKGLQAPIVFLPDTRRLPNTIPKVLWRQTTSQDQTSPSCLWIPRADWRTALGDALAQTAKNAQLQEYRRLLYVALTRAEDRLIVCGWDAARSSPQQETWHALVETALRAVGQEVEDPFLKADGGLPDAKILKLASRQQPGLSHRERVFDRLDVRTAPLPAWTFQAPLPEPSPPRPLAPSRLEIPLPPVDSPLAGAAEQGQQRFLRGRLIHRLLQNLPDLPSEQRASVAERFLARPVWGLTAEQQALLKTEVLAVLADPAFAPFFVSPSLAEAPISGIIAGPGGKPFGVSGQIDRLVLKETEALLLDFKTNRPPPQRIDGVPPAYLFQMGAYKAVLEAALPQRTIRCFLLWTNGPSLMELPPPLLDEALRRLPPAAGQNL